MVSRDGIGACSPPWGGRGCPSIDVRSFKRPVVFPLALFLSSADGTAQRESFRRFLHTTLQPLARIVQAELSEKLEGEVKLDLWMLRSHLTYLAVRGPFRSLGQWWDGSRKGRWLGRTHGA